jgi:hypothetical protein
MNFKFFRLSLILVSKRKKRKRKTNYNPGGKVAIYENGFSRKQKISRKNFQLKVKIINEFWIKIMKYFFVEQRKLFWRKSERLKRNVPTSLKQGLLHSKHTKQRNFDFNFLFRNPFINKFKILDFLDLLRNIKHILLSTFFLQIGREGGYYGTGKRILIVNQLWPIVLVQLSQ